MLIHADLSQRIVLDTALIPWVPSPTPGVERRLLDRWGGEVARATSLVRYDPHSRFPAHVHGGGEEFLVLEGVFRDEHGAYPAGTWVHNPVGSRHEPFTLGEGCTIFVKLHWMSPGDQARSVVDTRTARPRAQLMAGVEELLLHSYRAEETLVQRWSPGAVGDEHEHPRGEEILVLEGTLEDEHGLYGPGTWLRQPAGTRHRPASPMGCLLWMKRGRVAAEP